MISGLSLTSAMNSGGYAGVPVLKYYLASANGTGVTDMLTDFLKIKKNCNYCTQMSIAILNALPSQTAICRGGLILDPFCGSATACITANN